MGRDGSKSSGTLSVICHDSSPGRSPSPCWTPGEEHETVNRRTASRRAKRTQGDRMCIFTVAPLSMDVWSHLRQPPVHGSRASGWPRSWCHFRPSGHVGNNSHDPFLPGCELRRSGGLPDRVSIMDLQQNSPGRSFLLSESVSFSYLKAPHAMFDDDWAQKFRHSASPRTYPKQLRQDRGTPGNKLVRVLGLRTEERPWHPSSLL